MENVTSTFQSGLNSFINYLPQLIFGIVLILVAWIVAALVKKGITKGLKAAGFSRLLNRWGVASNEEYANSTIDSLGKVAYYLVWVLFLPGIFQTFGLDSIGQPIQNMIDTVLAYIPNILGAAIILILGMIAAKFVKNLVYNLAAAANIDSYVARFIGGEKGSHEVEEKKDTLANALGGLAYVLILFPIILVALEALNISTIGRPVAEVLNSILSAIPNILVALVLLVIGFILAKIAGDVLTDLIRGTGADRVSGYLRKNANMNVDVARLTGQAVAVLIGIIFFVEAMNALQLDILNAVGAGILAYIPNLIAAAIILAIAFIGGQYLAGAINKSTNSGLGAAIAKYAVIILGIFMALEQLNFATAIVQQAFFLLVAALALAFGLAFGLGGREFAKKQLEKADNQIDKEAKKPNSNTNEF